MWDRGPSSGLSIKLTWAQLSSITSVLHVTPAVSPSLSQSDKYKVLNKLASQKGFVHNHFDYYILHYSTVSKTYLLREFMQITSLF